MRTVFLYIYWRAIVHSVVFCHGFMFILLDGAAVMKIYQSRAATWICLDSDHGLTCNHNVLLVSHNFTQGNIY